MMYFFDAPTPVAPPALENNGPPQNGYTRATPSPSLSAREDARRRQNLSPPVTIEMDEEDVGSMEPASSDSSWAPEESPEKFDRLDVSESLAAAYAHWQREDVEDDDDDLWRSTLSTTVAVVMGQNQDPATAPTEQAQSVDSASPAEPVVLRPAAPQTGQSTPSLPTQKWAGGHVPPRVLTPSVRATPRSHTHTHTIQNAFDLYTSGSLTPRSTSPWTLRRGTAPAAMGTPAATPHSLPRHTAGSADGTQPGLARGLTPRSTPATSTSPPPPRLSTLPYRAESPESTKAPSRPGTCRTPSTSQLSTLPGLSDLASISYTTPPHLAPVRPTTSSSAVSALGELGSPLHTLTTQYRQVAYLLGSSSVRQEVVVRASQPPTEPSTHAVVSTPVPRPPPLRLPTNMDHVIASIATRTTTTTTTTATTEESLAPLSPRPRCAHTTHTQPDAKPRPIYASRARVQGRPARHAVDLELSLSFSVERFASSGTSPRLPLSPYYSEPRSFASPVNAVPVVPPSSILVSSPVEEPLKCRGTRYVDLAQNARSDAHFSCAESPATPPGTPPFPHSMHSLQRTRRFLRYETASYAAEENTRAHILADIEGEAAYRALHASLPDEARRHMPDPAALAPDLPFPEALQACKGAHSARTSFFLSDMPVLRLTRRRGSSSDQDSTDDEAAGTAGLPAITTRRPHPPPAAPLTAEQLGWKPVGRRTSGEAGTRQGRVSFTAAAVSPGKGATP